MRRVIIPTDFSDNALNALKYAVEFLKYEKSEITIVHAYADEVYDHQTVTTREVFEELKDTICNKSDTQLSKIKDLLSEISPNPNHVYTFKSIFGSLIDVINDFVEQTNADLVIMGTKGKTNDRKITFGSNTIQVMRYVKCPVLSIPQEFKYRVPKRILFPTNFMLPYKRRELKLLCTAAKSFRSQIELLYFSDKEEMSFRQQDNRAFLEDALAGVIQRIHIISKPNDLSEGINDFLKDQDFDIIVLVNSRHSYLEHILYTSTIDKIGLYTKIPLLVMQNLPRD